MKNALKYGMFLMPVHHPEKALAQCYDEDLELVVLCEQYGFEEFWVGEHHSSELENIVMPEIFIGKALGLSQQIRLGPAPVCLLYHHPVQVAGRLAFLDHLSHGRLNLCFGPGAVPSDLEMHGVDPAKSGEMIRESIDTILGIWSTDPPYRVQGKYWNFKLEDHVNRQLGIGELHKPFQSPHPDISIPGISSQSYSLRFAGQRGYNPFSHHMIHRDVLRQHWTTYQSGARESGRTPDRRRWKVSRNVFVAEDGDEARKKARANSLGWCIDYILQLTQYGAGNLDMWKPDKTMTDDECNLDYFMENIVIAGDPDEVTSAILDLYDDLGGFGTFVAVAHDWDDKVSWLKSLDLFAGSVMPAVERALTE